MTQMGKQFIKNLPSRLFAKEGYIGVNDDSLGEKQFIHAIYWRV